jgi:hypothetical protein
MNKEQNFEITANFGKACEINNLLEVKKILGGTGEDLVNTEAYNNGFVTACDAGAVDVAKFLYDFAPPSEFSLKEAFKCACDMSKLDSIKFLVFDTELTRKDVQEYIVEVKGYDPDFYQEIQQVFRDKMSMMQEQA